MQRRAFLTMLGAGVLGALSGCADDASTSSATGGSSAIRLGPPGPTGRISDVKAPASGAGTLPTLPAQTAGAAGPPPRLPMPGGSEVADFAPPTTIDRLDGHANRLALTVDDGTSPAVVDAYVDFAIASGIRLTFFPNGVYRSWREVRGKLAPLVESGQVQLANHTWDHPDVTRLTEGEIVDQLTRNEKFLANTYGVAGLPYFRPPYGRHNAMTDEITGKLGFSRTVLWWGSLGDSQVLSSDEVLRQAQKWFVGERIVIGHANHPAVTYIYPQLIELIRERNLQTVTLRDAFGDLPLTASLAAS